MKTKIRQIGRLLTEAFKKNSEEKAYQLYTSIYPNMTKETFIPFEKWYVPQKKQSTVEEKTSEQILAEVREIMNSHSVGGESEIGNI